MKPKATIRLFLFLGLILPSPARAQESLQLHEVTTVYFQLQHRAEPLDELLIERLQKWGQFQLVFNARQPYDAVLLLTYQCQFLPFVSYRMPSLADGWNVCMIALLNPKVDNTIPTDVWQQTNQGRRTSYSDWTRNYLWGMPGLQLRRLVQNKLTKAQIADAVVAKLRRDWEISARQRPLDLHEVESIYLKASDVDRMYLQQHFRKLKWNMIVQPLSHEADAVLEVEISGGGSDVVGSAELIDRRTNALIWSTKKDSRPPYLQMSGLYNEVVVRILQQLKVDWEESRVRKD